MRDDAGFLEAIIRDPADDVPRLIYADWLDDRGEADRAEFIRDQVEFRHGSRDWDLLDANLGAWCPWFAPPRGEGHEHFSRSATSAIRVNHPCGSVTWWRRGFLTKVLCPWGTWLGRGAGMATHPVESVRLSDRNPIEAYAAEGLTEAPMWGWALESWDRRNHYLREHECPRPLEPYLLDQGSGDLWLADGCVVYPHPDGARAALSRACLDWARARQGG